MGLNSKYLPFQILPQPSLVGVSLEYKPLLFPSLDGLRAVSVILVILGHASLGYNLGGLGVKIFFVISGFLITSLLLREIRDTGTLNLKNFYTRRFLRILPVAYLFLVTIIILKYFFHLDLPNKFIVFAALFLTNIFQGAWYVGHFWSLATEEQFYLIFPFILKKNIKTYIIFLFVFLGFILLMDFMNVDANHLAKGSFIRGLIRILNPLRFFDGIITGSLSAIFLHYFTIEWKTDHFTRIKIIFHFLFIPLLIFLYKANFAKTEGEFYQPFIFGFLEVVIIALLIGINLVPNKDILFQFLNHSWVKKVGVLSYSLYIWQQIFVRDIPWKNSFLYSDSKLLNIIALILVSLLSYYGFEKKFLKLKNRFR